MKGHRPRPACCRMLNGMITSILTEQIKIVHFTKPEDRHATPHKYIIVASAQIVPHQYFPTLLETHVVDLHTAMRDDLDWTTRTMYARIEIYIICRAALGQSFIPVQMFAENLWEEDCIDGNLHHPIVFLEHAIAGNPFPHFHKNI